MMDGVGWQDGVAVAAKPGHGSNCVLSVPVLLQYVDTFFLKKICHKRVFGTAEHESDICFPI